VRLRRGNGGTEGDGGKAALETVEAVQKGEVRSNKVRSREARESHSSSSSSSSALKTNAQQKFVSAFFLPIGT